MDTRSKIVTIEELQQRVNGRPIRWVRGHFDPLLAEHAQRLEQLRSPGAALAVIVDDSSRPLLPARARAELVAALASVDFVVLGPARVPAADLDDSCITREFTQLVRQRHRSEGEG